MSEKDYEDFLQFFHNAIVKKRSRKEWLTLGKYIINRIRRSAHDMDEIITIQQFIKEFTQVARVYLHEEAT